MFAINNTEDNVVKLRSSLDDIKFLATESLSNNEDIPEHIKSVLDDIIKIADLGLFKPKADVIQRAKQAFNEDQKCCGDE
mgnify:CR=1 FL=1